MKLLEWLKYGFQTLNQYGDGLLPIPLLVSLLKRNRLDGTARQDYGDFYSAGFFPAGYAGYHCVTWSGLAGVGGRDYFDLSFAVGDIEVVRCACGYFSVGAD